MQFAQFVGRWFLLFFLWSNRSTSLPYWLDALNYNQYICDYEFPTLNALQFNSFYSSKLPGNIMDARLNRSFFFIPEIQIFLLFCYYLEAVFSAPFNSFQVFACVVCIFLACCCCNLLSVVVFCLFLLSFYKFTHQIYIYILHIPHWFNVCIDLWNFLIYTMTNAYFFRFVFYLFVCVFFFIIIVLHSSMERSLLCCPCVLWWSLLMMIVILTKQIVGLCILYGGNSSQACVKLAEPLTY